MITKAPKRSLTMPASIKIFFFGRVNYQFIQMNGIKIFQKNRKTKIVNMLVIGTKIFLKRKKQKP